MDIKDFSELIKRQSREVDQLVRRQLPVKVGRMAKDHYQDNFRKGGFVNRGLQKWATTRRQQSGSASASASYGPLLSGRNHLFSSIKYVPGDYRVMVSNDLPYAAIHNQGGTVSPTVTFCVVYVLQGIGQRFKGTAGQEKGYSAISVTTGGVLA